MRPLIRRSAAMRDRQIERAEHDPRQRAPRPSKSAARQGGTGPGGNPPPATREDISKRHAAIPEAINTAYTIAPISRIASDPNNMPKKSERMKGELRVWLTVDEGTMADEACAKPRHEGEAGRCKAGCEADVVRRTARQDSWLGPASTGMKSNSASPRRRVWKGGSECSSSSGTSKWRTSSDAPTRYGSLRVVLVHGGRPYFQVDRSTLACGLVLCFAARSQPQISRFRWQQ